MRFNKGFSLVELSTVLVVIGIILGSGLTLLTKKTEADKINETERKMGVIQEALALYLAENLSLPCQADINDSIDATTFGVAKSVNATSCTNSDFSVSNVYAGTVPTKTLKLPDDMMIDGWGRRFLYVVDYRFARSSQSSPACDGVADSNCIQHTNAGSITINNESGGATTTEAIYAILSHGKNGHGAFTRQGGALRISSNSADLDEQENCECNASASPGVFDSIFVQKTTTEDFDDILRYKVRWQIMSEANSLNNPTLCAVAEYRLDCNADAGITCQGAVDAEECCAIESAINGICFDE